jgi:hypothetical protein
MSQTLKLKVGDTSTWTLTLMEGASGKNLTSPTASTAIELYMRRRGATALSIDGGSCTKDADQTTYPGQITFTPTAGQVGTRGEYVAEVHVTWTGGAKSIFPADGFIDVHIGEAMDT